MKNQFNIFYTKQTRREFLSSVLKTAYRLFLFGVFFSYFLKFNNFLSSKQLEKKGIIRRINTKKCVACGACAASCIKPGIPAIQALNNYKLCGFCIRCGAYFIKPEIDSEESSNLVCPFEALVRDKISENMYRYTVDLKKCHGCGACVRACRKLGQGALKLFVNQMNCLQCDICLAQKACMQGAFITTVI